MTLDGRMDAKLGGRMEARITIVMPIYLHDVRRSAQPPELALTENVSSSGVRVVSKWKRKPGEQERFTLLSGEEAFTARVVYCHPTPHSGYSVGLRLREPSTDWWRAQTKPPRMTVADRWAALWQAATVARRVCARLSVGAFDFAL